MCGHKLTPQQAYLDRIVHDLYDSPAQMKELVGAFAKEHKSKANNRVVVKTFKEHLHREAVGYLVEPQMKDLLFAFGKL